MEETSYLLGDRSLRFWIEGFVIMVLVVLIVKAFKTDKHEYKGTFFKNCLEWLDHNKRDLFLSITIPYVLMLSLEWTEPLFEKYTTISLPHTGNEFLWFIPITGFVAYKLHDKFHGHKEEV